MSAIEKIKQLITVSLTWRAQARERARLRQGKTVHVLFCMCDHYEPGTGKVSDAEGDQRVADLLNIYPEIADRHHDSSGKKPTRTWFYPPHYHRQGWLKKLVSLCERGYGEVELHLHHGKDCSDTSAHLRETIQRCLDEYARFGIFGRVKDRIAYGFIHGDWALDNSRNGTFCGVNDEISILVETGCYADFTFPAPNMANPRIMNSIYYATDDPARPKSHDHGRLVKANTGTKGFDSPDLLMVQGPLHPIRKNGTWRSLRILGDSLDDAQQASARRTAKWLASGISVQGKENWVIVKTHTHGASDAATVLGPNLDEMFSHLEQQFRDRAGYALHYVTARELYNIIRAAECGEPSDNPDLYRDYIVSAPSYDASPDILGASPTLAGNVAKTYAG